MKLKKIEISNEGNVETVFILTPDQYHALINHAINDLLTKGIVETVKLSEEELQQIQQEAMEEIQKEFLAQVPTDEIGSA